MKGPGAAARPEATTFECIEYRALREPDRIAVVEGSARYSYLSLYEAAIRFTRALAAQGLRRGQAVAISRAGSLIELTLVLACENLGCATASFQARDDPEAGTLFAMVDWVLSELPQPEVAPGRGILLDDAFAARVRAIDPHDGAGYPRVALELHEPQRFTRTSGSTGRAKWMRTTRQSQETSIRRVARESQTYGPDSLVLIGHPFIVNGALTQSLGCLRLGAAVAFVRGDQVWGLRPTHFHGLPAVLERFLSELPAGFVFDPPVTVATVGGFPSQQLRARIAQTMRGPTFGSYTSNEAGNISPALDERGEGWLAPGVDVRIVDGEGAQLPAGEIGAIALRTSGMVAGYLDAPAATAQSFRGGWFTSGDSGALLAPRRLRLVGRHDDLLVVGGVKIVARELEDGICRVLRVPGAAVCGLARGPGGHDLGIAVVDVPGLDREAVARQLRDGIALPAATKIAARFVKALPRTANGKIDRVALLRLFDD